jgi:enterochelin esterase-like enzyme
LWWSINLLLAEHPVCRLGQVARDSYGGAAMTLAGLQALVEFTHVAVLSAAQTNGAVGSLYKSPF